MVVDSAFNISAGGRFIIQLTQKDPDDAMALLVNRDEMSIRRLIEWGIRMIQGYFSRSKDPIR